MKLCDLIKNEKYEVISGDADSQAELKTAYTSDLLSDVMGNMDDDSILITIQAHKNSVAVAGLKGAPAILFCNGRTVGEDVIVAAEKEGIVILSTKDNQFLSSLKVGLALELLKD